MTKQLSTVYHEYQQLNRELSRMVGVMWSEKDSVKLAKLNKDYKAIGKQVLKLEEELTVLTGVKYWLLRKTHGLAAHN